MAKKAVPPTDPDAPAEAEGGDDDPAIPCCILRLCCAAASAQQRKALIRVIRHARPHLTEAEAADRADKVLQHHRNFEDVAQIVDGA